MPACYPPRPGRPDGGPDPAAGAGGGERGRLLGRRSIDQNYGTDAGAGYQLPDGGLDVTAGEPLPDGQGDGAGEGSQPGDAPPGTDADGVETAVAPLDSAAEPDQDAGVGRVRRVVHKMTMSEAGRMLEWEGGTLDELLGLLAEPALSARIEAVRPGSGQPVGEVHVVAGGVAETIAGEQRGRRGPDLPAQDPRAAVPGGARPSQRGGTCCCRPGPTRGFAGRAPGDVR